MRVVLLCLASLTASSSHAYFVFDERPTIAQAIQQCSTSGVMHLGTMDTHFLYGNQKTWDFRQHVPLGVMRHHFNDWRPAMTIDDTRQLETYTFGTLADALTVMANDRQLCILLDWATKSYYLLKENTDES